MKTPKIALLFGMLVLGLHWTTPANAQDKKGKKTDAKVSPVAVAKGNETLLPDGFTRLASGLEYKIMKHGTGKRNPQLTDHIEMNIVLHVGDSVIFNSRKMNNDKSVPLPITAPKYKGDPMEGFMLMVAGDSAVLRLPVDSLKKIGAAQPWMKEGTSVEYNVSLLSVKSEDEEKKENAEKAEKQTKIDDQILQDYFKNNNIKPKKTASGLYYSISVEGHGDNVKAGQSVGVNYTGMFMDGKKFDSNTDTAFHHTQPFVLEVGKGRVIKGWDEGLQLLKTGSKATFYIPSPLAYGSQDRSPQIPANSILIFEVEILDMPDQGKIDDKLIQEYLAKINVKATKTPSGLYYIINQKGLGNTAKPGKKVTMNYTGKTLDGKVFDSNTDPAFNHVQPFTFTLGQGMVIKGWDEGVQLLNLGSKATFIIPSGLAYGAAGAQGAIAPNAVLLFDVEVTGIDK
jgi:FKBP-type peptidyl-prolyl cis-trans isomerase FkpA